MIYYCRTYDLLGDAALRERLKGGNGMAFGVSRQELQEWKKRVMRGEIALLTHYWYDERWPDNRTITKVGCNDLERLAEWCRSHGLDPKYIHRREKFPHFDLIGPKQRTILEQMGRGDLADKFRL